MSKLAIIAACALLGGCAAQSAGTTAPAMLRVRAIELPAQDTLFGGPEGDLLNANCLACHSPSMVLTQPRMNQPQWRASVVKMRDVYHAPIADADVDAIAAALAALDRD